MFSITEIIIITKYSHGKLYSALKYAVKSKQLIRLSRGLYAFDESYSKQEFANKLRSPSYISLYTVLQEENIVFQPYSSVFSISNRSETIERGDHQYLYRKIQDTYLLNPYGILFSEGINKAKPERALCDKIYLDHEEYFDNLRDIDWKEMKRINTIVYKNNQHISTFIRVNMK